MTENIPKILIVEDNPVTRKLFLVTLIAEGFSVLEAGDARTALELTAEHAPSLIIQGLILPDMDGFELLRRLRKLPAGRRATIIACSGLPSRMEAARSSQLGFTDFLFKPVEPSRLVAVAQAYLRPQAGRGQPPPSRNRLLIAHDDPIQRELLKVLMEDAGFDVTTLEDGQAALTETRRARPSAIISDVLMPQLDGFQLCLAVRQDPNLKGIPVVLISAAHAEEADLRLARAVGANGLLTWTSDRRTIVAELVSAIGKPAPLASEFAAEIGQAHAHRLIRQVERQANLNFALSHRVAVQRAELAILAGVAQPSPKIPPMEDLLEMCLYRCLDGAGVSKGLAYAVQAGGRLVLACRPGYPDEAAERCDGFFGHDERLREIVEKGEIVHIPRCLEPDETEARLLAAARSKALLVAPVVLGSERLGVIIMASEDRSLREDETQFAAAVAAQIGRALELGRTMVSLHENRERLARILDTMADGLLLSDADGRFTMVNPAAENILGLPADKLTQRTFADPPWKAIAASGEPLPPSAGPLARILKTGEPLVNEELRVERPDGNRLVLLVNGTALRDDAGEAIGTITCLTDITMQKHNEDRLAEQARELSLYNVELRELASVAAHDLQEPLRNITVFSQLLADEYKGKLDEAGDGYIDVIVGSAARMRDLIADTLRYSNVARREIALQATDAGAVFRESLNGLKGLIKQNHACVIAKPLPTVMADPLRLSQVFQNLIENALKYRREEAPRIEVWAENKVGEWIFAVQDNGIGIDSRHVGQIFEIFERLHHADQYPGTGIGLAICRRIVEQHRGRIWVESEPGAGAKFCFTIPVAETVSA